ncbi:hypothetical protein KFK09_013942 [Dendrobium nobile]|uniref:Reverse transcriptase domain-containing protein n=1 Tax=Dendrobium nobile TaxID=94219 RepID=A0A8T3BAC0_DENNO|nr:hypothetical protein KFK09_013942 [Dendrobium nobile]
MASPSYSTDCPPVPGSGGPVFSAPPGLNFLNNLTNKDPIASEFSLSFVPPAPKVPFFAGELQLGTSDWSLSLVGYSVGPRPAYLSLQNQWNPKFIPKRDEFTSIPIWVKIVDLPLAVWNPPGISKIASFIGHPLAVDALTARKTRLTFARVCILVTSKSTFPDEIPISLDGDDVNLKVIYDWKPTPCSGCGSLVHPPNLCPKNPQPKMFIHGIVSTPHSASFAFTAVYAANSLADRISLWKELAQIAEGMVCPWVIMGGASPHHSQLNELNSWLFDSGTFELSSTGLNFTWFNQRSDDPIHIKLDRMIVNFDWLVKYPTSYYTVEPPGCSDHSPLILYSGNQFKPAGRFLFKNYWIHMEGFWDCVLSAFSTHTCASPIANLYLKLKTLKNCLKKRNWSSANFLQDKVLLLEHNQSRCLELLQRDHLNPELNISLKEINCSLGFYQKAWTNWIMQRGKAKWLSNGEDDLGYLYARIKSRGNSNCIKVITTAEGMFSSPYEIARATIIYPKGSVIPQEQHSLLTILVTSQEIKEIIFSSSKSSSPGPDGYTYEFYKSTWSITGHYVCQVVKIFFETGSLPNSVKATAIVLIPKTSHASHINEFRPISLCNTFYKIIAKILANRMKPFMPKIIHNSQAGFIKDRLATDNIILAMEILKDFKNTSGKDYFCAKLDIKKAFDCISRDFIISRMHEKGFPPQFISWIKGCIFDVPFSVCINGALQGYFTSTSGLRQGCPLSPLLFAIAMDAFSGYLDGRIQYLKFTIANTIAYWIRGAIIPKAGCKIIDRMCARFLYHGSIAEKKLHLISWKKTTMPYCLGGLGIPDIKSMYFGFASTFLWRFYLFKTPLNSWYKLKFDSPFKPISSKASHYWKLICSTAHSIKNSLNFHVSDSDCSLSLIWDPWVNGQSLADLNLHCFPNNMMVCNLVANGIWDLRNVPVHLQQFLHTIPIQVGGNVISWTGKGVPNFKTFSRKFFGEISEVPWHNYIWHKHFAIRYSSYTWLAINGGLKTADVLAARRIHINTRCYFCHTEDESTSHLFFQCPFSFSVLHSLIPDVGCFLLRPNILQLFEYFEDFQVFGAAERNFCYLSICCMIYFLWRERNDRRYGGIHSTVFALSHKISRAISVKVSKWKHVDSLQITFPNCFFGRFYQQAENF